MAGRGRRRALVRHVVLRVRQQIPHGQPPHERFVTAEPDLVQLVRQHAQLRVGQVAQLEENGEADDALRPVQGFTEVGVQLRVVAEDLDLRGKEKK